MHFKRILSLVLVFCLLAVLPPIYVMASSIADDGWQTWENIRWSFDESSQTLTVAGEGDMPEAESFMDFPWYGLGEKVNVVRVEEGITSIAVNAFFGLSIADLYLPETLQRYESHQPAANVHVPNVPIEFGDGSIGLDTHLVFEGENPNFFIAEDGSVYNAEKTRLFHAKYAASFVLPDTIEELDSSAFTGADKLVNGQWQTMEIVFPENCKITEIKDSTFQAINGVKNLVLPEGIEKIGRMAFYHAMNVSIPKTVRQIENDSFWQAGEVTVDPENPYFSDDGHGALLNKDQTILYHVPSEANRYDIPNTVKTVIDKAFNACRNLVKVVIPESVTELGDGLFMNCDGLRCVVVMNWNCKFDPNTFVLAGFLNDGNTEGEDVYIEVYGYPNSTTKANIDYVIEYREKHKEDPELYGWRFSNFTFKELDTHQVENGGNLQVGQGSGQALQFHVTDVEFDINQFTEVFVDCELVPEGSYELKEGSFIVEFKQEYLNSLSGGEHTINAVFQDGGATGKITVDAATYEVEYQDPLWAGSTENGMMIATDARFDTLVKILVDDVELDPKDYTIDKDFFAEYHTVILSPEYLKSLTNGEHKIKFIYAHGEGEGSFQVGFKNDIPTTSGSASVWKDQDPDVTVEMEGDPDEILYFYLNGDIIDPEYFDVTESDGVMQIKVSQKLLETLAPGNYVFHVLFEDGDAEFRITVNPEKIKPGESVVDPQEPASTPNPGSTSSPSASKTENPEGPAKTADMGMPVAAFTVMVIALGGACWLLTSKKTKH